MAQKERENFYRISTVIVDHGQESLSAVLENDLSNTNLTFEDFINRHHHEIYHLCYNRFHCCQCTPGFVPANKSRILYPDQLDILLDKGGSTLNGHNPNTPRTSQYCCRPAKQSLSTSNLDITLLRCLIMNFAQNVRTNSILRQDVEGLVRCRNTLYAHVKQGRFSDAEYTKHKAEVEGIILRIALFCNIENEMKQKLKDASQRPLDESILLQYHNTLLKQSSHEMKYEEKVDELQQQMILQGERVHSRMNIMEEHVSEVGQRKRNIIDHTKACLLEHSKDETYVVTEDVKQCCEILERYKALVIFAKAGGGKSKTSLQIAKMYQGKMYTPMLFVNDEIVRKRDFINFKDENIVIIEDLFGRSNIDFNEHLHRGILDVLYSCIKNESCKTKLIITIRGDEEINRNLIEKHIIFEKDIIIDLEKSRSRHCNKLILTKHMEKHGISLCECKHIVLKPSLPVVVRQCSADVLEMEDNTMRLCVSLFDDICCQKYEIQIGFPQACFLFCSNKNLTKQGITYFRHTSKLLVDEINKLKAEGFDKRQIQYQYGVLVYTAMKRSIDLDDIDEKCFLQILSSVYDESQKIIMSLLKTAIIALQGTYMLKHSPLPRREINKHQKATNIYVLQHNTIQEAVLISYGEDVDVLPFCDIGFLLEYIRPKGYIDELSDKMVLLFTEYKPLVKRLISMLLIDNDTCIGVGMYLQNVALLHRRDEIIHFFFQNMENVEPEQYTNLVNGLTSLGKNGKMIEFHPDLCRGIMIHADLAVFLAFCRPIGWEHNDTHVVEMETDVLIKTLFKFLSRLNENGQERKMNLKKYNPRFTISLFDMRNGRYLVGAYVFNNLIEKGFINVVHLFFTNLIQNTSQICPIDLKYFLDGLLFEDLYAEKRSSIVSQFKLFFEAVLFKYGSLHVVLQWCRPLTTAISSQNIIKVDDRFLAGKLAAYLESAARITIEQTSKVCFPRENGIYFVFWDEDYFSMKFINDIAKYISEHGFHSNNNIFVQMVYAQFVSDEAEKSSDEESVDDDIINSSDGKENQAEKDCAVNGEKVVFDEYPFEELIVNANGVVIDAKLKVVFVKRVYCDNLDSTNRNMYTRLFLFLKQLDYPLLLQRKTPSTLMGLHQIKFESLMDDIKPERRSSGSDFMDYFDDSEFVESLKNTLK